MSLASRKKNFAAGEIHSKLVPTPITPMRLQAALLVAVAARGGAGTPNCTVYIADPGTEFNSASTSEFPGSATPEKHVAHWMHTGLLSSALRTSRIQEARVIFVAHYFLKHQEKGWTLHVLDWIWLLPPATAVASTKADFRCSLASMHVYLDVYCLSCSGR